MKETENARWDATDMNVLERNPVSEGFKPTPQGPWTPYRFKALEAVRKLDLLPGDICLRSGNAVMRFEIGTYLPLQLVDMVRYATEVIGLGRDVKTYIEVPFSPIIATISGSKYSHAAMVYHVIRGWPIVLDVSSDGCKVLRFIDWLDDTRSDDILFLRAKNRLNIGAWPELIDALDEIADRDPGFDPDFVTTNENLYCTEAVYEAYAKAGIDLGPPTPFNRMPGWDGRYELMALLGNLKPETPVYSVGNERLGLLASDKLYIHGRIALEDFQ